MGSCVRIRTRNPKALKRGTRLLVGCEGLGLGTWWESQERSRLMLKHTRGCSRSPKITPPKNKDPNKIPLISETPVWFRAYSKASRWPHTRLAGQVYMRQQRTRIERCLTGTPQSEIFRRKPGPRGGFEPCKSSATNAGRTVQDPFMLSAGWPCVRTHRGRTHTAARSQTLLFLQGQKKPIPPSRV